MLNYDLHRNSFGRLILSYNKAVNDASAIHEGVTPVRAFPICAPNEGVALLSSDGHELEWIDDLAALPENMRTLLQDELKSREFIPEIKAIRKVSSFATPSIWEVETDRGHTRFVLKGEDDIRRLKHSALLIADSHGVHFLIRDTLLLDRTSRKILDRFL